ncbi:MAG: hypothetical protein V2J16_12680 [Thermoleophilia bacterium]|nr:hypothetical protein [Thermoleophilia bacterium]
MNDDLDRRLREALRDLQPPPASDEERKHVRAAVRTAAEAAEPQPRRRRVFALVPRRPAVRLGLAAAAICVLIAAALFGGPRSRGPESVSAGEVLQRALVAFSSGRTLQTDVELTIVEWDMWQGTHEARTDRYRLAMRADGSYRLTLVGEPETGWFPEGAVGLTDDVAYDARTGTLGVHSRQRGLIERLQYPMGPPDRWAGIITQYDFSAGVRALEAARGAAVEATTYEGRPAWLVTCSLASASARPAVTQASPLYVFTIDRATSLPLRFQAVQDEIVVLEVRYRDLRFDEPLPRGVFVLDPAQGADPTRVNEGFRRVDPSDAQSLHGYATLAPDAVPQGFTLVGAAAALRSTTVNGLVEGRRVFALQYARGFDALTVTTRRVEDPEYVADTDPFEPEPTWAKLMRHEVTLRSGAFAGATAMVVVAPKITTPHLWAVKDGLLLTVAGTASEHELVAVAESLEAIGP